MSLRTISTRRLLAWIAAIVAVACGGTAIAVAATGGGPVPQPKPLATAVHDALSAPAPPGITARVEFTNHLISSDAVRGVDPILTGASGRLWLTNGHLRLELQSERGDAQLVADDKSFWVYDPRTNTVYRGEIPQDAHPEDHQRDSKDVPSVVRVQRFITRLAQHADVSTAVPSDVAGRPAYTVRVSPRPTSGLLGAGELAWDALRGVPLRIGVFARGASSPVLQLKVTDISFESVPASSFAVSPPTDAKVVKVSVPTKLQAGNDRGNRAPVVGVKAVQDALPFSLSAPATLSGVARHDVRLLDLDGHPAALVTYGRDLGGLAVLEQGAGSTDPTAGGDRGGLDLPSVSINGVAGRELPTALGTVVHFERGKVAFTVAGSRPPEGVVAAARELP
jgi:outer membrane lipoprotein-sorting protein